MSPLMCNALADCMASDVHDIDAVRALVCTQGSGGL